MNSELPNVSVLMSVYAEPIDWINQAVQSILNQTFTNFEFIIVNDNPSSKALRSYLEELQQQDNRIKILTNSYNLGLTKSLNNGLKNCAGKYIARMDSDDWAYPNRLAKQVRFMDNHPDVIASSALAYSWDGENLLKPIFRPTDYDDMVSYTFTSSPFIHPLLIMRKDVLVKNNITYDEYYPRSQDYKLAIDLLKYGKITNLPEYLLKYRISKNQITSKFGSEQVELCKLIRRKYINDFYAKYGFGELDKIITIGTVIKNRTYEFQHITLLNDKKAKREFRRSMNSIRRLLYYSLNSYSLNSLFNFISSSDYFRYPYKIRRCLVIVMKHLKANIVPKLL